MPERDRRIMTRWLLAWWTKTWSSTQRYLSVPSALTMWRLGKGPFWESAFISFAGKFIITIIHIEKICTSRFYVYFFCHSSQRTSIENLVFTCLDQIWLILTLSLTKNKRKIVHIIVFWQDKSKNLHTVI